MPIVELDALTEEEQSVRDTVHKFAEEVMRPAGAELDRMRPEDVIAEGSALWEVHRRFQDLELGHERLLSSGLEPAAIGRLRCLINEELGWGDAGLAISLEVSEFPRILALATGLTAVVDAAAERAGGHEIGCWAITEPNHGSDMLGVPGAGSAAPMKPKPDCVARPDGDDWVINGQKSAWVSNGTIAHVASLFCSVDPERGFEGGGIALVPLDLPGVSRGAPLDKLGQRALNQGEIFFEDVRIPKEQMVITPPAYGPMTETVVAMANMNMGTIFVGVARAALEHALAYARERVQGGCTIADHPNVRVRLFDMFRKVEAARSLARRVTAYGSTSLPQLEYSIASKTLSTRTAFEVADDAVQILGGNGLTREYPVEKLLRDARASMIEDGCNEFLSIVGGGLL